MGLEIFIAVVFGIPLIAFIWYIVVSMYWSLGIIPKTFTYNKDNLCEIIILLSALIIRSERKDQVEKAQYMGTYLRKEFPEYNEYINGSYARARNGTPIKIKSACNWINKNIGYNSDKSQIVYFLVALAMVDGRMNSREKKILKNIATQLKIDQKEFDSIIAGHEEAYRRKQERQREANKRVHRPTQNKRKQMARILEVSENASFDEIKKAYRSMVKLHHPDRFQNNGPEQIKLAQERFIEIQLAYEYFENLLN